jgi:hypothetical protein
VLGCCSVNLIVQAPVIGLPTQPPGNGAGAPVPTGSTPSPTTSPHPSPTPFPTASP